MFGSKGGPDSSRGPHGLAEAVRTWASHHPALLAFLVMLACGLVLLWYVFLSGLGDPAGFVYNQF